ncbi:Pimeloyl-ACP methyl ester carboxylesterase [Proteiniborus ethanoligenes]|uniref:Pimeloyl-ACP methyl ester carboxylesterase n=1 Tax=Proteiniborus ethanoligenes TaxID=415015 RepID=A0A1H3QY47_9FIRM|nr:alpha/beta hydrolase [Proteiniborus ethanoligenes]SDZ18512.1 Pimeloyl-ACP methyl ester carboxylesterase [Proteiniborus ethanoligenes]
MKNIELRKVKLPNGETYRYRYCSGGEKNILLIHGNLATSKYYDELMEALPEDYTIYAVDMRGFGASTYNTPISSLRDIAEDIKLFADELDLHKFDLVGWSTGGAVSMHFTANYGHMVNRLFLLASAGALGYPSYRIDENGNRILLRTKEEIAIDPAKVGFLKAIENKDKEFYKKIFDAYIFSHRKPEPNKYDEYLEDSLKQQNIVDIYYSLGSFNITDDFNGISMGTGEIKNIKVPTAVIQGEEDKLVTLQMAQSIEDGIGKNAKMILLKDSGHTPFFDKLDEVVKIITEF